MGPTFTAYYSLFVFGFSVANAALPLDRFSTKTAYEWAHYTSNYTENELFSISVPGMTCSASYVTVIARHGARFPGDGDIIDISNLHSKIKSAMHNMSVNVALYNWSNPFDVNLEKRLVPRGEEEHRGLGERTAKKLSNLFAGKDVSDFGFLSSDTQRTKASASSFYRGFFNASGIGVDDTSFEPVLNNSLMRFYDYCDRYNQEVDDNDTAVHEYERFVKGYQMQQVVKRIAQELGIDENLLDHEDADLIYKICAFETGIFDSSPWCSLLGEQDLEYIEYAGDLEEYYKDSYGHDINWQQSCLLVSDIFSKMRHTIKTLDRNKRTNGTQDYVVGQFDFGHTGTLAPFMTALGLFEDSTPLTADNFAAQQNRLFQTSKNLCFSTNVMFILYQCNPQNDTGDDLTDYYLKLLVNEEPVVIPACGETQCSFQRVVEYSRYKDLIDQCQFKELCKVNSGRSLYNEHPCTLILTLLLAFILHYNRNCL